MEHGRTTFRRSGSRGLEVLEAEWLGHGEDVAVPLPASTLRVVATAADPAAALDTFLRPWLGSQRSAFHPITSLVESLAPPGPSLGDGALKTLCRAVVR